MMDTGKLWNKDFIILCIANFLFSFAFYAILAILPLYLNHDLNIPKSEIGFILSAYTLGALLIRPFSGIAFDHWNKRLVLLTSMVFFALLFLAYGFLYHTGLLIFLRLVQGFAWGVLTTGMVTVTVDIIPVQKRGTGIGYLGISMTLAMALSPPLAIAFANKFGFLSLFYSSTAIATLSLVVALFASIKSHVSSEKPNIGKHLISKAALPVSISIMLFSISYGGIMSFITLYAAELGFMNAGRFFLFLAIGLITTRFFSGKIFDQYGPKWVVSFGFILGILGLLLLSITKSEIQFLAAALSIGLGFGSLVPASQAMINNVVSPQRRGAGNSTFLTFFDLGIGSGMLLTGYISNYVGYSGSYFICAIISSVAMGVFFLHNLSHYHKNKLD